jgi:diguanylate cyclase (GGDEF)-like protein
VELVSALGGDRALTDVESGLLDPHKAKRGSVFFSDLLYAISHQYFAPEIAESLWHDILAHKHHLSVRLGRDVRITVATLDYLSINETEFTGAPTLMSEADVSLLANLAMRDGLTGLYNYTTCREPIDLELRNFRRHGIGVSLLLLDIDDFKSVNDRSGHQEGDRVLAEFAWMLVGQTREPDVCCRIGGEEFAVILLLTGDAESACEIGEQIRAGATTIVSHEHRLTVSVGVAVVDDATDTTAALLNRADRAMYRAKVEGKNRVVLSETQQIE